MAIRTYLRAGEVPIIYGLDRNVSEWALWNNMREGEDRGAGDYGKWQSRLAVPIMQGIAEDHRLRVEEAVDPHSTGCPAIMPTRCWRVAASMTSGGRPALLVVVQKSEASLREWKEPDTLPPRQLLRFQAIAAAHDVRDVLVGVLVDGYSSRVFHVQADEAHRADIRSRATTFARDVIDGIEPDIDFASDAGAIRQGVAVARVEAAATSVQALVDERGVLLAEKAPADATMKRIDGRIRQIETSLIHMAGEKGRIETDRLVIAVQRNARGTAQIVVAEKAPAALF